MVQQAVASDIMGLIQSSTTAVDGGVRHVEEAGTAMKDIVRSVQRVGDIIGEITAAASEQSAGMGQVNSSAGEIDRMTQQNAALEEESAAAESLRACRTGCSSSGWPNRPLAMATAVQWLPPVQTRRPRRWLQALRRHA